MPWKLYTEGMLVILDTASLWECSEGAAKSPLFSLEGMLSAHSEYKPEELLYLFEC